MKIITAVATETDPWVAFRALAAGLSRPGSGGPDFVAVHGTVMHDGDALARAAAETGLPVHGGSSCRGVMTEKGFFRSSQHALGGLAIHDPEGAFGTGAAVIEGDPRAAGRAAIERALAAAGRPGEAPDLVWLTQAPGREEAVLAGIADVVGDATPVFGGSSADDDVSGGWYQFTEAGRMSEGVVASALFPSSPIALAYQSGYEPTDRAGVVTAAEGRVLFAIDGEPAARVYERWTGGAVPAAAGVPRVVLAESTFHPLGRHVADVAGIPYYILAHPAVARPDGALEMFADLAIGDKVTLMAGSSDSLVRRAGRVARAAIDHEALLPDAVAGALVIYCGGCMMAVEERMDAVVDGVREALGGAPFLGAFTFGEQGCMWNDANRHGNLMISCAAFGR